MDGNHNSTWKGGISSAQAVVAVYQMQPRPIAWRYLNGELWVVSRKTRALILMLASQIEETRAALAETELALLRAEAANLKGKME